MLLSRVFSLLLGTTLFVMIWTMQDGDHATPRPSLTVQVQPLARQADQHPTVVQIVPVQTPAATVVSVSELPVAASQPVSTTTDPSLWIFADEPAAQIAVK